MIVKLTPKHRGIIYRIINQAAFAYKGVIPADCYHEPYMPLEELQSEMRTMTFYGWSDNGKITGVMAVQQVKDVTLVRHAYVLPEHQGKGIGTRLLAHLRQLTCTKYLLVGTWADATWAVKFYQKHGFTFMPDKDGLLVKYWNVPPRQIETSVVLGIEVKYH
jgi:GNAT superfamily N-acetyltransferase